MARTTGKRPEATTEPTTGQRPARRPLPRFDHQKSSKFDPKVLAAIGGAVVLVLFIVALVVGLANEPASEDSMPDNVSVTLDGDALPPYDPTAPVDPAVGMQAPAFTTADFAGTPVSLSRDGTPKAILFLAHWCPHCQVEVPTMQAYINQNGLPEGVELVSVVTSTDPTRPNYPPSDWLAREGWTAPVYVDDAASSIGQAYGLSAFPYYVFVDGGGTVVARVSGEQQPESVVAFMEQLVAQG